ncbi:hypothetical protein Tco_0876587 [Tanacetum coccineum]|uniref:Uncharacterized protein n=1 Tax=Tanacetum coccineum TaxID=301880 RepID=A0ABQ5BVG7_9ASTR
MAKTLKTNKDKDLKILEQKTKSKDNDEGSRSKITKHEGTSLQLDLDLFKLAIVLQKAKQIQDFGPTKSVDTHEGTGLKPGVLDVSKAESSKNDEEDALESDDDLQQADNERTDSENQMTNDEDEESKDAFVHTPEDYVPTDDETNDETKDVDEEEYERISEELCGDVNVKLIDVEHNDEEKGDAYMTNVAHVQVEQTQEQSIGIPEESGPEMASIQGQYVVQATTTTTHIIQNATSEVPPLSSSHSISSTYTNAFLNLENLHSIETKVVSMLDINVQHEVPRTSPLLTIHVSVIPEYTVFHPSKIVTTAPATTITSLLSSLFSSLQQSIPIPTPTNTKATTKTIAVPKSETLSALHQRITNLEKDVKELKNVNNSTTVISTIKFKVPNVVKKYLGSSLDNALYKMIQKHSTGIIKEQYVPADIIERLKQQYATQKKFDQKTTLFNTMTKYKSINKSPKHRALYHALIESILKDEDAMDKGVADELKKMKPDDADKNEGPIDASDRGLKRQRTSKGTKTSKKTSTLKDSSKGKSPTTSSKSSKSAKDQVEEPIFMQDSDYAKHDDAEFDYVDMPMDQGKDLGKTDEQPNDEAIPKNDWYKKSKRDTSLNPEWNKGKLVNDGPEQSCLNDLAKDTKPPLTFDELMHTPIDFSTFAMSRLKIDNLTKEHLIGPVYNLLKGTCKSYVELDYTI